MVNLNYENTRFLDVVNDKDEVIDSKSRTEVYTLGLLHREIHVWMFDENKNIFFQKRGLDRRTAGLLDSTVGGHVNAGEDYLEAAVRETKEETGIAILSKDLILLKKIKSTNIYHDRLSDTVKSFIRSVYIYKKPIKEQLLQKEVGVPGVGFQKISYIFLSNLEKEYVDMFLEFVLREEVPLVLKYLK